MVKVEQVWFLTKFINTDIFETSEYSMVWGPGCLHAAGARSVHTWNLLVGTPRTGVRLVVAKLAAQRAHGSWGQIPCEEKTRPLAVVPGEANHYSSSWCVLCSVSPSLNVSSITIEQPIEENGAILKKVSGSMHGNLLWAQAWMFHTLCSRMSASQKTSSLKTLQPSTHADTWQRQPSAWTLLPLFTGIFTNNSRSEKQ
jgi:hypothetical protein